MGARFTEAQREKVLVQLRQFGFQRLHDSQVHVDDCGPHKPLPLLLDRAVPGADESGLSFVVHSAPSVGIRAGPVQYVALMNHAQFCGLLARPGAYPDGATRDNHSALLASGRDGIVIGNPADGLVVTFAPPTPAAVVAQIVNLWSRSGAVTRALSVADIQLDVPHALGVAVVTLEVEGVAGAQISFVGVQAGGRIDDGSPLRAYLRVGVGADVHAQHALVDGADGRGAIGVAGVHPFGFAEEVPAIRALRVPVFSLPGLVKGDDPGTGLLCGHTFFLPEMVKCQRMA
ncbi:MAG: hypothetical protein PHG12_00565 [Sphaerochaeta sp.]|nr:hypothetical protein [Sphaerochaeta sp.]